MQPILEFKNISKRFPGVLALNDVSISILPGEIHALVGENGAGKSTLIKTCSGALKPTHGEIIINGKQFEYLSPVTSRENGIAVIYQEFNLVNELSVAENVFLGEYIQKGIFVGIKAMEAETQKVLERLSIHMDPTTKARYLTVGYQQMVEVARALTKHAKILIMDEPSASLTTHEVEILFRTIKQLKEEGVTILYISHRLDEIFEISDRVTVMRDGEMIKTMNTKETDREELVRLMVGRTLKETFPDRGENDKHDVVLHLEKLTGNKVKGITMDVKRGEILGLGGVIGAGRTELAELLFGLSEIDSGDIVFEGQKVYPKSPESALKMGITLVPEDRKQQGVLLDMTIRENISMPIIKKLSRFMFVRSSQENDVAQKYRKSINIKTPSILQRVKFLSGGNQQKVAVAKGLATEPKVIIFDEPTRGIDVGAKQEIYQIIDELAKKGIAIIMISSDMEELLGMSDRIVVLHEGKVVGELNHDEFNQEKVLRFASGYAT